jgi:nucleoside-triphosphatase THEP1
VRVGRYGVEPAKFEPIVQVELVRPASAVDAFVVDEIGKIELHSASFVAAVRRILDGPAPMVATVALN